MYSTYEGTSKNREGVFEPVRKGSISEMQKAVNAILEAYDNQSEKDVRSERVSRDDLLKVLDYITAFPDVKINPFLNVTWNDSQEWCEERLVYLDNLPSELCRGVDYTPVKNLLKSLIRQSKKDGVYALFATLLVLLIWTSPGWILMLITHFMTN